MVLHVRLNLLDLIKLRILQGFVSNFYKITNKARLKTEIDLLRAVDHPNIIKILDAYTHSDVTGKSCTVLEMEWLNGMDLQRYIDEKAKKGLDEATIKKILLHII